MFLILVHYGTCMLHFGTLNELGNIVAFGNRKKTYYDTCSTIEAGEHPCIANRGVDESVQVDLKDIDHSCFPCIGSSKTIQQKTYG